MGGVASGAVSKQKTGFLTTQTGFYLDTSMSDAIATRSIGDAGLGNWVKYLGGIAYNSGQELFNIYLPALNSNNVFIDIVAIWSFGLRQTSTTTQFIFFSKHCLPR